MMIPGWLTILSAISIIVGIAAFLIVTVDLLSGHQQRMWIMNLVWPLTALYSGVIGLFAYYYIGRRMSKEALAKSEVRAPSAAFNAALGAMHCGSGCALGDILAESFLILVPLSLFGRAIFAAWTLDFILAFGFGITFQYFTIKPLRHLSVKDGMIAALKADALSLTAWQVGMYGWMAIATFLIFGHELAKTGPVFWFMMQIAMLAGFLTAYPVNWLLIKRGLKEKMQVAKNAEHAPLRGDNHLRDLLVVR